MDIEETLAIVETSVGTLEAALGQSMDTLVGLRQRFLSGVGEVTTVHDERVAALVEALDRLSSAIGRVAEQASEGYDRVVAARETLDAGAEGLEGALNAFGEAIEESGGELEDQVGAVVDEAVAQVEALQATMQAFGSDIAQRLGQLGEAEGSAVAALQAHLGRLLEQDAVGELRQASNRIVEGLEVPAAAAKKINEVVKQTLGGLQSTVGQVEAPLQQVKPALELMKYVG